MKKLIALLFILSTPCLAGQWTDPLSTANQLGAVAANRELFFLKSANMNVTTDQALSTYSTLPVKYTITNIYATNCSGTPTVAVGGFYTAISKGGTAVVAATQAYSTATSATYLLSATLNTGVSATTFTANPLYFSLTTGQGSAMTCDLYVYGSDLP